MEEHRESVRSDTYLQRFRIDADIYDTVTSMWGKYMSPFITEGIYSFVGPCWKNQISNLLGMIVVDTALGYEQNESIEDKWYLFSLFLKTAGKGWYLEEVSWEKLEKARKVACQMHGKPVPYYGWCKNAPEKDRWREYYDYIVKPMMLSIAMYGAHGILFKNVDDWRFVTNQLEIPDHIHMDEEVVKFLIEDATGYILACDCNCYNPLWVFGSECYEEIIRDISK